MEKYPVIISPVLECIIAIDTSKYFLQLRCLNATLEEILCAF